MIYLDANILIRLIEGDIAARAPVEAKLQHARVNAPFLTTSRLSRLECRVKPLREGNSSLLSLYEQLFNSNELQMTELHAAVIEKATELRSTLKLKTPDAIHLASAIVERCSLFLTGDKDLAKVTEIAVEVV
ncbi:MAG TPA: type II toxin-antitoxin system VapC family toxin [Gemmatales bacterium]|nr:type II toxin-antitoxin system VapC family toxin [Gemmatales bacterium]